MLFFIVFNYFLKGKHKIPNIYYFVQPQILSYSNMFLSFIKILINLPSIIFCQNLKIIQC